MKSHTSDFTENTNQKPGLDLLNGILGVCDQCQSAALGEIFRIAG
jgi:hypothetical protein